MKRNFVSAGAVAALVVMGMALSPAPVLALPHSIIFTITPLTSGTISYNGSSTGPMVGTNISVDTVTGFPGPPLTCGGCLLNFKTGNFTGFTHATWNFAAGG